MAVYIFVLSLPVVKFPECGNPQDVVENVKVEKIVFDAALSKVLKAKPVPRSKIKARGKRAPKTPILSKP